MHRKTFPLWFSVLSVSTSCRLRLYSGSFLSTVHVTTMIFSPQQRNIRYFLSLKKNGLYNPNCSHFIAFISLLSFTTIFTESHSTNFFTSLTYYQWCIYWLIHHSCPHVVQSFSHITSLNNLSSQNSPRFVSRKVFTPSLLFFSWSVLVIFPFGLLFLCPNCKY